MISKIFIPKSPAQRAIFKTVGQQLLYIALIQQLGRLLWFVGNVFWLQPLGVTEYFRAFAIGFYFDLPVIAYLFCPLWLWWALAPNSIHSQGKGFKTMSIALLFITFLLNAIDAGYSNVTSKRSGIELWDVLLDPANEMSNYILDYWWGALLILGFCVLLWKTFPMPNAPITLPSPQITVPYMLRVCARTLLVLVVLLFLGRGGWRLRPLQASDASEFVPTEISPLLVSTPFAILSSVQSKSLQVVEWVEQTKAEKLTKGNSLPISILPAGIRPNTNIVLIVVESLARDYTGFLNGAPYTPFLDRLAKNPDAIVFPYCFANGTKSIEMAPSIFAGMPNLTEDFFITSSFSTNRFTNAFGWLKKYKYTTQFFHGSNNGTMGFQSFLKNGGLQQYFGINEYPNANKDFDGQWGIFDEPYLQYFGQQLSQNPSPFFSSVFTLSSHHPYNIPSQIADKLPGSNKTVQKTIAYADYSLQQFFTYAQQQAWFSNTLFIITGDHTSHGTLEYFYSPSGHYEVPLIFYAPNRGQDLKLQFSESIRAKSCSHLDILPTAFSFVFHRPNLRLGMGRSLLDSSYRGYSCHFSNGLYYLIQYPLVLSMNENGETVEFYKQLRNSNKKVNLIHDASLQPVQKEMSEQLQAMLQQYRNALIQNKWDQFFN